MGGRVLHGYGYGGAGAGIGWLAARSGYSVTERDLADRRGSISVVRMAGERREQVLANASRAVKLSSWQRPFIMVLHGRRLTADDADTYSNRLHQ